MEVCASKKPAVHPYSAQCLTLTYPALTASSGFVPQNQGMLAGVKFSPVFERFCYIFTQRKMHLGHMASPLMHILLNPNAVPKCVNTATQVPVHIQAEAHKVFQAAIDDGVIVRVDKPARVGFSRCLRAEASSRGVRLICNLTWLNSFIQCSIYPFHLVKDILQVIKPDAKDFCVFDAVYGYLQVPLDEESSHLTTFLLPDGQYWYLVAPMGQNSSGDEWC